MPKVEAFRVASEVGGRNKEGLDEEECARVVIAKAIKSPNCRRQQPPAGRITTAVQADLARGYRAEAGRETLSMSFGENWLQHFSYVVLR